MLRRGSFTGTQRKTNQLKQVVGAPKPASSRLRILSQGTSRCARHFFPLPLLLASSARRQTRERSLEDPRSGGLREKPRSGGTALRHGHGPGLELTMSDRILVTGATGLQGGAVARHLLKLGKPEVRCLTRRPHSEAAKTFKQLGAEVVKADLDDPASLKSVLRGCTGVFGVTDFWEAFLREYDQGVNLIDAASEAGVGHLVLST